MREAGISVPCIYIRVYPRVAGHDVLSYPEPLAIVNMVERIRQRNQLLANLPQLQNLIKRDPAAYREEVRKETVELAATVTSYISTSSYSNTNTMRASVAS